MADDNRVIPMEQDHDPSTNVVIPNRYDGQMQPTIVTGHPNWHPAFPTISNVHAPVVIGSNNHIALSAGSSHQATPPPPHAFVDDIKDVGKKVISEFNKTAEDVKNEMSKNIKAAEEQMKLLEDIKKDAKQGRQRQEEISKSVNDNMEYIKEHTKENKEAWGMIQIDAQIAGARSYRAFTESKTARKEIEKIGEQMERHNENLEETKKSIHEKLKENHHDVKSDIQSISSKVGSDVKEIKTQVSELHKTTENMKSEITRSAEEQNEELKAIKTKQGDIEVQLQCAAEREGTQQLGEQIKKNAEDVKHKFDETQKSIHNVSEKLEDTRAEVQDTQSNVQSLSSKMDDLSQHNENMNQNIQQMGNVLQSQNPTITSLNHPKLQKNAELLINYVAIERLIIRLFSTEVITMEDKLRIQAGEIIHDKVERLLLILDKKPDGVEQLKSALLYTGQETLVNEMDL